MEQYAHRVGQKKPNPWGFYDLHGNVCEWCRDYYAEKFPGGTDPLVTSGSFGGAYRVDRGGTWGSQRYACRSAIRDFTPPEMRSEFLGFRVALIPAAK